MSGRGPVVGVAGVATALPRALVLPADVAVPRQVTLTWEMGKVSVNDEFGVKTNPAVPDRAAPAVGGSELARCAARHLSLIVEGWCFHRCWWPRSGRCSCHQGPRCPRCWSRPRWDRSQLPDSETLSRRVLTTVLELLSTVAVTLAGTRQTAIGRGGGVGEAVTGRGTVSVGRSLPP